MTKTMRGATVVLKKNGSLTLEQPTFELIDSKGKKHFFDMPIVRVGAGAGNDLKIDSLSVSSSHVEIASTEKGVRVRDLGSTNGTTINGVRIRDAMITDGQTIGLGSVELRFQVARDTVQSPMSQETEFHGAVGTSAAMRATFSRVERVAKTDATVMIHGETGTGKEVMAWSIFEASKRKEEPFVVVDCSAIARNLIESELFGHEKGAFTGAINKRTGAFERAHGGTLFLDELGELELDLQPKLLRALERREIQRVGGEKTIPTDVRIIAATNRDLRAMVARGEFREDLYYRLAVVTIDLPPLRERRDDIPVLVERFLSSMNAKKEDLPAGAVERFMEHDWPGNCRELKNAVERAVVLGETKFIGGGFTNEKSSGMHETTSLPAEGPRGAFTVCTERPYKEQKGKVVADFEERYVRLLVSHHKGNVSAAARVAGIDRMSLHKILQRYGLDAKTLGRTSL